LILAARLYAYKHGDPPHIEVHPADEEPPLVIA
jgi:hypothetical protein